MSKFQSSLIAGALITGLFTSAAQATIVTLETSAGNIDINLYDETTPETVENFLAYVNDGLYNNTFIHRSVPGFVVQGGGYGYGVGIDAGVEHIEQFSPVANDPQLSNVRGTIAMAKPPNQPDGATSEFFFNLIDNGANLDDNTGGFTVFGEVSAEGMAVVDAIADLPYFNFTAFGSALTDVPVQNYTAADYTSGTIPLEDNIIIVYSATITDAATDTAAGLNPPANPNYGTGGNTGGSTGGSSSGGGGSLGVATTLLLGLAGLRRRKSV